MTCIKCRQAKLVSRRVDLPAEVKGESVVLHDFPALVCPNCAYVTIPGSAMAKYMRRASDAYRAKNALLTSDEIRSRRQAIHMSQSAFANYMGVGPASIKRWELGQVQDKAMDHLIRLKTDPEEAANNYLTVRALTAPRVTVEIPTERCWAEGRDKESWATEPLISWIRDFANVC